MSARFTIVTLTHSSFTHNQYEEENGPLKTKRNQKAVSAAQHTRDGRRHQAFQERYQFSSVTIDGAGDGDNGELAERERGRERGDKSQKTFGGPRPKSLTQS